MISIPMKKIFVVLLISIGSRPVMGQMLNERRTLWPSIDSTVRFADSIAVSDSFIVAGTQAATVIDLERVGSFSIFDRKTGQELLDQYVMPQLGLYAYFGHSVAINDTTLAVSAHRAIDPITQIRSGMVVLFDLSDPTHPALLSTISYPVPVLPQFDYDVNFGDKIAMQNGYLVVTAPGTIVVDRQAGAAYVFDIRDPFNPIYLHELLGDGGVHGQNFGTGLDLNDQYALVGAANGNPDAGIWAGAAFLFDLESGEQIVRYFDPNGSEDDWYGASVAISDRFVALGALGKNSQTGSVTLIDLNTHQPIITFEPVMEINARFGESVDIDAHWLLVGAPRIGIPNVGEGVAYLYDLRTLDLVTLVQKNIPIAQSHFAEVLQVDSRGLFFGYPLDFNFDTSERTGSVVEFVAPCEADLNADNIVDILDIEIFLDNRVDMNIDGHFNYFDASIFMSSYISNCS